ncbi:50S ribosomal protein L10 [Candidatus Dojkabacteria bacterium]|nr:50S ribosomal protein L10 [Candidatus Dojkabacteria bacterium]
MAKTRAEKAKTIKAYSEGIKSSKAIYIIEPCKLTANQSTSIKKALYGLGSKFNVVKNTLFVKALEENEFSEIPDEIKNGQKAVVFSSDQVSESAKVIKLFMENRQNKDVLKVVSGYLDQKYISADQIQEIAELPSKEVMIARVLGTMKAPISGFVNVLGGNISNMINVINAIKEQKENTK